MGYKVLIPTAGTGSRLGGITRYINKSLVNLGNKPAISRIIESFPDDTEFVIPTGYKGQLVKEYLYLAYPEKKIYFTDVLLYEGFGSGLGLTILTAKDYLQEPFIFCSCDTLVNEKIPAPNHNWMGYDHRENKEQYRTVHMNRDGLITDIEEKGMGLTDESQPYIGLAGIYDYELFWHTMQNGGDDAVRIGESYGLRELVKSSKVEAHKFTWFDTGVTVELDATRKRFESPDAPNILEKQNEAIWFIGSKVIKFSDNTNFISNRVKRAKLLEGYVPRITASTTHMYCYDYAKGDVLSKCISLPLFQRLLAFSKKFWSEGVLYDDKKIPLPPPNSQVIEAFKAQCMEFYKKKTYDRVAQFYENFNKEDNAEIINSVSYPSLKSMLDSVNWDYVADGMPGQFHGDYHFENIIYDKDNDTFELIDWRQNFGEFLRIGDIYYDLAKLNHGLIICHELIAKDLFEAEWIGNEIKYDFARKNILVECERYYYKWLNENGFDVQKVKLITALIFLNICALHDFPYVLVLYALGKQMLFESMKELNISMEDK